MPNHYHLLVHTPEGNLAKAMQYFLSIFSKRINTDINADGSVFRDRYKSILIDSTEYLLQLTRYIHLNPVEAHLSKSAERYKWSSYCLYTAPVPHKYFNWVKTNEVIKYFSKIEDFEYFHNLGVDTTFQKTYSQNKLPNILGSKAFIKSVKEKMISKAEK